MGACEYPLPPISSVCDVCEVGFGLLEDIMDFKPTEELIDFALDYICYMFPEGDSRTQCEAFVDQEYDELINYLVLEFPAESICILIGACESNVTPVYETECELCRILYQFALDLLDFNASIEAVEALLEKICTVFPMQRTCEAFVDKFYEQIVNMLMQKYPTEVACEAMGACV